MQYASGSIRLSGPLLAFELFPHAAASRRLSASAPPAYDYQPYTVLSPDQANQQADILIGYLNATTDQQVASNPKALNASVQILSEAVTAAFGTNASAIVRKFEMGFAGQF